MLIGYPDIDIKRLCKESGKTLEILGKEMNLTRAALSMRARGQVINKGYVEMCEALGYDIRIEYVKR